MYRDKIQDYNQHKQWLQDFFEGEFIHPNLLKIDSQKGEGFIFFYKIHPGIYFMYFHIDAKEDISFEFDYSSSFYFNYIASFFNNEIKIRNEKTDVLSSFPCDGFYVCTKDIVLNNSVKKGEKLHNINIFFSEETFREIDEEKIAEYHLSSTHFLKYFDEHRDIKAFKMGLEEVLGYSKVLRAKILPVKMQELYYIFLNALKNIQIPSVRKTQEVDGENLSRLFKFRNKLVDNLGEKPDVDQLLKNAKLDSDEGRSMFSEVFGNNPINYFNEVKMQSIKSDLLKSRYSISEISEKYGFPMVQHFSTTFKRKFGHSPSDYLKKIK